MELKIAPLIISVILTIIEFFTYQPSQTILIILFLTQYIILNIIMEFSEIIKIIKNNFQKVRADKEESPSISTQLEDEDKKTQKIDYSNQSKKYVVFVDDNFHYMDESERYKEGEYDTCEEAVTVCKRIVDDFLELGYKEGMSYKELYGGYVGFGEDPFIISPNDKKCFFSAWTYAKQRCRELCGEE